MNRKNIDYINNLNEGRDRARWADIREFFLKEACAYQSTIKLWDAQKEGGPLFQRLPDFIDNSEVLSNSLREKLKLPLTISSARNQLNRLIRSCGAIMDRYFGQEVRILSRKDLIKLSKGVSRSLALSTNVLPNMTFKNKDVDELIR